MIIDWLERTIKENKKRLTEPGWDYERIKRHLIKLQAKLDKELNK